MSESLWSGRKMLVASGTGLMRVVGAAPVYLISVPFLVRLLGTHDFGIWVLITTITGWMFWADFGLRTMIVREVSALTPDDEDGKRAVDLLAGHALTIYLTVGALVVVFAWLVLPWVLRTVLQITDPRAYPVVCIGLGAFVIDLVGAGLFRGFNDGTGHLSRGNLVALGYTYFNGACILATAFLSRNVVFMAGASAFSSLCGAIVWWRLARNSAPWVVVRPKLPTRTELQGIVRFAGAVQLNDVIAAATPQLLEAIVVRRFGLSALGLFDIGVQLSIHIRTAFYSLWGPLMPWLRSHRERSDAVRASVMPRFTALSFAVAGFGLGLANLLLPALVPLWLGARGAHPEAIVWMCCTGVLLGTASLWVYEWNAVGRPEFTTLMLLCHVVVVIALTLVFAESPKNVAVITVVSSTLALLLGFALHGRALLRSPAAELPAVTALGLGVAAALVGSGTAALVVATAATALGAVVAVAIARGLRQV